MTLYFFFLYKTDEYKNLDDVIKQNTMYKQAMFMADQQLKQLRRKAVVVINDERYKLWKKSYLTWRTGNWKNL